MVDDAASGSNLEARTALAARLWRAAERQAAEVEARIADGPRPAVESERDAKVLAVLARTLRELSAAEAAHKDEIDEDEDAAPDTIEELRSALRDRLRRLAAEPKAN
jgi:hypothetical protein